MTTPSDSGHEPADLSELTATDALLDRLGARNASDDDLLDATAAVLAELTAAIDRARDPDADAARLIEVLAGRPLYIAGADPASDETPAMIDLSEPDGIEADAPATADAATIAAGQSEPLVPATRLPSPAVIPIRIPVSEPVGPRRLDRMLSHASLPAASVVLLLAIGGGVSAAVTGNPMTPVNGITQVVAQLPGVDDSSLERVKSEIRAARRAVAKRDAPTATMHLAKARAGLDDVADEDKTQLNQLIAEVATLVPAAAGTTPGAPPAAVAPGPGSVPVPGATAKPVPVRPPESPQPTASATASASPKPTDSLPTVVPSTPDTVPSTDAVSAQQTPAATHSSP